MGLIGERNRDEFLFRGEEFGEEFDEEFEWTTESDNVRNSNLFNFILC